LEMNESTCDLNESLEITIISLLRILSALEPEVLEYVVGLIILLLIETVEKSQVPRIELCLCIGRELGHKFGDAIGFFHLLH